MSTQKVHNKSTSNNADNTLERKNLISESYSDSAVAVIGIACKFSEADSLEQFWKILEREQACVATSQRTDFLIPASNGVSYSRDFEAKTINDFDALIINHSRL